MPSSTETTKARKILFIQQQTPYSGHIAYESIEAILMAGVFDQKVSVLFVGDGVYQLIRQDAQQLKRRSVAKLCESLIMYDIEEIYVDEESLHQRALTPDMLCLSAKLLTAALLKDLISKNDIVITN